VVLESQIKEVGIEALSLACGNRRAATEVFPESGVLKRQTDIGQVFRKYIAGGNVQVKCGPSDRKVRVDSTGSLSVQSFRPQKPTHGNKNSEHT